MRPSQSKHSRTSPITKVPCDVLLEIFLHCLPQRPLQIQQSNAGIAPLLLCHICSSWRTVALACPTLWSDLSYLFPVEPILSDEEGTWSCLQNEIELITWWKKNQGSIPPFLYFDLHYNPSYNDIGHLFLLAGDGFTSLLNYLSSAQYLQMPDDMWKLVEERLQDGYQLICPNLHTLVTSNLWIYENGHESDDSFCNAQILMGLIPNQPPSKLRRLSIHRDALPSTTSIIPTHWSLLTHLSLHYVDISLAFWFSLIRAVPDLQWAFIYFIQIFDIDHYNLTPTEHTLPYLSTLFFGMVAYQKKDFRPGLLLTRLHLPALHTLSFSCSDMDHEHIPEIYTSLQSTPGLTTLTIRGHDDLAKGAYLTERHIAALGGAKPIWAHTPHLTQVQLDLPRTKRFTHAEMEAILGAFVCNAFFGAVSLLALDDPGCPLRTITLVDMESATVLRISNIRNLTMAHIQQHGGGSSNIVFKFITKAEDKSIENTGKFWNF